MAKEQITAACALEIAGTARTLGQITLEDEVTKCGVCPLTVEHGESVSSIQDKIGRMCVKQGSLN